MMSILPVEPVRHFRLTRIPAEIDYRQFRIILRKILTAFLPRLHTSRTSEQAGVTEA